MILPQRDKEPDLAFAGLAILILFGFLILHDNPIKSSRPADPASRELLDLNKDHAYESWLWEDPFGKEFRYDSKKNSDHSLDQNCWRLREEIRKIREENENEPVKIFAALLDTSPNTNENEETRIRHRYAKIAGLIEAGYSPSEEPQKLHYCRIDDQEAQDKKYNVSWEYFSFTQNTNEENKKPNDVILLWLDDSVFNSKTLLTQKKETINNAKVKYITNNAHEFLISLINQSENWTNTETKNNLYLFDWSYSEYCWNGPGSNKECNESDKKVIDATSDSYPKKIIRPLKFLLQHSEHSELSKHSRELVEKLTKELVKYRRIKDLSEIAIIVEQDTKYIRKLSETFSKEFPENESINRFSYYKGLDAYQQRLEKEENRKPKKWNEDGYLSSVDLRNPPLGAAQYDYLHRMATQIKNSHKAIDVKKRIGGIKAVVIFGSDFDDKLLILQALRSEMPNILILTTDLDARMLHPQYFRWTRNLVVASSFGLRFPHPKQNSASASGDNQQILQTSFTAFRDSQQTEIFYNTKRLLTQVTQENSSDAYFSPVLFEIGRNGHVFLPQSTDDKANIKKILPKETFNQEQNFYQFRLLFGITCVLICLLYGFRPNSMKLCIYIFCVAVFIFSFYYLALEKNVEPVSFTNGISLWPAIFIQIIAIALALYFCKKSWRILNENLSHLQTIFKLKQEKQEAGLQCKVIPIIFAFIILLFSIIFYAWNDFNPETVNLITCAAILFIFIIRYIIIDSLYFINKPIAVTSWADERKCNKEVTIDSTKKNTPKLIHLEDSQANGNGLWTEYNELSQGLTVWVRMILMWLIFAFIETILFYLVPSWPQPVRGDFAFGLDWLIGIASFIVIMFLTFFVLDTYRLSYYFIRKLRKQHPLIVDDVYLALIKESKCCQTRESKDCRTQKELAQMKDAYTRNRDTLFLKETASHKALEKIISLVAERTRVVDGLIYYPLICIILMLFARISYFDNQDFPYSKAVSFGASISLLIFAGFMIRSEAEKLKFAVIKSAESLKMKFESQAAEIDATIEKIGNINSGVFQPMLEQPVMRTLLLILGFSGILAGEFLMIFG